MATELARIKPQIVSLAPRMAAVLPPNLNVARLQQTMFVAFEQTPKLAECSLISIQRAAMSAAILGLECDGVTGQGYFLPFKGRCQFIVGYKGYNTLAARGGYTIDGALVRDGDQIEIERGTNAHVRHTPDLRGGAKRQVLGAWAAAYHKDRPPIVEYLTFDEIEAVRKKSPNGNRPPWTDQDIGWPAMAVKTAKRRLARAVPMGAVITAAAMEERHEEMGRASWIDQGNAGPIVRDAVIGDEPDAPAIEPPRISDTIAIPGNNGDTFSITFNMPDGREMGFSTPATLADFVIDNLQRVRSPDQIAAFAARNPHIVAPGGEFATASPDHWARMTDAIEARRNQWETTE